MAISSKTVDKKAPAKKPKQGKQAELDFEATTAPKNKKAAKPPREKAKVHAPSTETGETHTETSAHRMAKQQREISVSEFFSKNRHLLGFDNPRKALMTTVKEAVDNALDACEEARILPDLKVEIAAVPNRENRYVVAVEDNGPGIVKDTVPKIFGKLLYGSKFHRLKMSRGQQGIGIAAAGLYGHLTTGRPLRVTTRIGKNRPARFFEIQIDAQKNAPIVSQEKDVEWATPHGTRVEIELEGKYLRGKQSVDEYLSQTAIANPHVHIEYSPPEGEKFVFERATKELPREPKDIKPHPYGVELGNLIKMLQATTGRTVKAFLQSDFSRVSPRVAVEICKAAGIAENTKSSKLTTDESEKLYKGIQATKIQAPSTDCISPIGDDLILKGLQKEVKADFYSSVTRPPAVYRGNPFQIEVGLAYGKPTEEQVASKKQDQFFDEDEDAPPQADSKPEEGGEPPMVLLRLANRVPLLYQQSACAIFKAVATTDWKSYGLSQPRGSLPLGHVVCMVHMASVWVPFTSESKEAIAHYPEIIKQIKLALQECGRQLGQYLKRRQRELDAEKKKQYMKQYVPIIIEALDEILGLKDTTKKSAEKKLQTILERSRS